MPRLSHTIIGAGLLASATLAGCSTGGSTHARQAAGDAWMQPEAYRVWWDQQIAYNRHTKTYFDPRSGTYYWFEDGAWTTSDEQPQHAVLTFDGFIIVERSRLLERSRSAPEVVAFNPFFVPVEEPIDAEFFPQEAFAQDGFTTEETSDGDMLPPVVETATGADDLMVTEEPAATDADKAEDDAVSLVEDE